jgi:glycosyltransferase involved in cell wall biosynthesis
MRHISVAIPTFNRAHLIRRTIESVLKQEYQDYDLLVVDDASCDGTVAVVEEYCRRDPRVRLVVNEQNLGLTRNWNRCLELAAGPLVQLLLSDDLIDPDYLGKVSEVFERHPQLGFVAASCRYIDENDEVIHPGTSIPAQLYQAGDEAVTALLKGGFPHVSSIVMRRECYETLGGFKEDIWHGPDGEMDARIASRFDFYHFGSIHTCFRRHGSNMGNLEFLRSDFLAVDTRKKHLAWSYLSPEGRHNLGVDDIDVFIARDAAQTALGGATVTIGYGRPDLSRFYLKEALRLDPRSWRLPQFWKACILLLAPSIGRRIMGSRMRITGADRVQAHAVESSLMAIVAGNKVDRRG